MADTMRAAVFGGKHDIDIEEVAEPTCGPTDASFASRRRRSAEPGPTSGVRSIRWRTRPDRHGVRRPHVRRRLRLCTGADSRRRDHPPQARGYAASDARYGSQDLGRLGAATVMNTDADGGRGLFLGNILISPGR